VILKPSSSIQHVNLTKRPSTHSTEFSYYGYLLPTRARDICPSDLTERIAEKIVIFKAYIILSETVRRMFLFASTLSLLKCRDILLYGIRLFSSFSFFLLQPD